MYSRGLQAAELQAMTVANLVKICKERGIPHYHGKNRYHKSELVDTILEAEKSAEKAESAQSKIGIDNHGGDEAIATGGVEMEERRRNDDKKLSYIEGAGIGTIVAFRLPNGKVKSAAIVKRSAAKHKLMLETAYGRTYVVKYESVIWVRHGKRWPKGVYELLKRQVGGNGEEATD